MGGWAQVELTDALVNTAVNYTTVWSYRLFTMYKKTNANIQFNPNQNYTYIKQHHKTDFTFCV